MEIDNLILTIVTFTPALGGILLLFFNRANLKAIRGFALLVSVITFVLSLHLIAHFDSSQSGFQYSVNVPWIPSAGISYQMGIDGISVFLVLLATILTPLAILASWSISDRPKEYFLFMLMLETGMIGVFVSLDLFLFYLFWEVMLVPMYFLIGVWGGERRIYAAMKFVLYTMIGGVLMLVAILALYFIHGNATGVFTFSYPTILAALAAKTTGPHAADGIAALSGILSRVCDQGAALSLPYLASGRSRGSADRGFRSAGRRAAQDGNLWIAPVQPAAVSEHQPFARSADLSARHCRNHLWSPCRHGPAGSEEAGGLLFSQPSGLHRSWDFHLYTRRVWKARFIRC